MKIIKLFLLPALILPMWPDTAFSQAIFPYTNDAYTVLLDHFDGSTSAGILAYRNNGAPCGSPLPSTTPSYSYGPGAPGLNQGLTLYAPASDSTAQSYLKYPGGELLTRPNGTMECWIYLTSYNFSIGQFNYFGECQGHVGGIGVGSTGQLGGAMWYTLFNVVSVDSGTHLVPLNTWTHVALSWGSAGLRLYLNGALVGTNPNTGSFVDWFGLDSVIVSGNGNAIDELRISSIQRTSFNVMLWPPTITNQPVHTTASTGSTATFTVGVSGTPPLRYQWLFDGTNISGATNAALSLSNVSATNLGFYSVTISNVVGGAASAPVGLFIVDLQRFPGLVINGPTGTNYDLQSTPVLGTGSLWTTLTNISLPSQPYIHIDYRSQTNPQQYYRLAITNAAANPSNAWGNLATLDLKMFTELLVRTPAGTNYDLQTTAAYGSVSNWTTLANVGLSAQPFIYLDYSSATNPQQLYRVVPGPAFSSQPLSTTTASGGTAVFTAAVTGTPPYSYQWTFNGTNIVGATNLSLTITNVSPANVGLYALNILNGAAPLTSIVASLATVDLKTLVGLIISGCVGTNYAVQSRATLGTSDQWTTLTNITLLSQPDTWIDYGSLTNPQQYYRLAATNAATRPTLDLNLFAGVVIYGPLGSNYNVQALGSGGDWMTLTNIALPSQPYIFIDYNSPTNPQQSYRAVPQ